MQATFVSCTHLFRIGVFCRPTVATRAERMIPNLLLPAKTSGQFLKPRQTFLQRSAVPVRRVALCSLFDCRICRSAEWKANSRAHQKHQPRWVFYPDGKHAGYRRGGSIVHQARRDRVPDSGRCYAHNARSRIGFRISGHRAGPSGMAQYMAYGNCRLRRSMVSSRSEPMPFL